MRKHLGDDVPLMVDANQQWDRPTAQRMCRIFEQFNLVWIEEPLDAYDHEGHAALAAQFDTPIATGEMLTSAAEHGELIRHRAADYLMPDAPRVGGITPFLKVAALAEQAGLMLGAALRDGIARAPGRRVSRPNRGSSISIGSNRCSTSAWRSRPVACSCRPAAGPGGQLERAGQGLDARARRNRQPAVVRSHTPSSPLHGYDVRSQVATARHIAHGGQDHPRTADVPGSVRDRCAPARRARHRRRSRRKRNGDRNHRHFGARAWSGSLADACEKAARATGLRLVGPNCLGVLAPRAKLNASFAARMPPVGDLALMSQSGAITAGVIEWSASTRVGFSAVVSVGETG